MTGRLLDALEDATRETVTRGVLEHVLLERRRQVEKWGDDSAKDRTDGTGRTWDVLQAAIAKAETDTATDENRLTWRHILLEEVREALAETDPALLRAELVQVAAVAVKWIEAIDRRADS